jgi:hypothetical protein
LFHCVKEVQDLKVRLVWSFQDSLGKKISLNVVGSLFLNPEVFSNCPNLQKNVYYGVEPVGQISTYPNYGGSATSTPTLSPVSITDAPFPTYLFETGGGGKAEAVIPIADGTRKDCTEYVAQAPQIDKSCLS